MQRPNGGFHGEFSSANASALSEPNARFTLYNQDSTALTLQTGEQVVITDIWICSTSGAQTYTIYDGANNAVGAGETVAICAVSGTGDNATAINLKTPHFCTVSTYPKLKAAGAGQVDAVIRGYIVKAIR